MRIFLFLFFISVCFMISVQSQESKLYERFKYKLHVIEGKVRVNDGSEIEGLIKLNSSKSHWYLTLVTKDGRKLRYLKGQINEYWIGARKYESFDGRFLKLEDKGSRVSLYSYEYTATHYYPSFTGVSNVGTSQEKNFYLRRGDEDQVTIVPSSKNNFKNFASYFSECEVLINLISNGSLDYGDLKEVVRKYNSCK